jgi:hypothetical protein
MLELNDLLVPGLLEEHYPLLLAFKKRIESRPRIAAYLQSSRRIEHAVNPTSPLASIVIKGK